MASLPPNPTAVKTARRRPPTERRILRSPTHRRPYRPVEKGKSGRKIPIGELFPCSPAGNALNDSGIGGLSLVFAEGAPESGMCFF